MVWRGKGRSGIGDQYLDKEHWEGASYEDWQNLSPNGRQVKNPLTDEVRDLSGMEYWHLRKSKFVDFEENVPHFRSNGAANISAYAALDTPKGRQPKQESKQELAQDLLYSLNPDEKKLDSLDEKEQALTTAYIDGLIEVEQYEKAIETILRKRYAIHKKMAKASCEDMQQWIEENGSYEDKKKLYNSKNYQLPLATQARLLAKMKPKESTLNKVINWFRNN